MTSEQLRNTFQSPFDINRWYNLLHDIFKASELKVTPEKINDDPDEEGYYLGNVATADYYRIGFFIFNIRRGSVANRRVGLRRLVRNFTNPRWGEFDAALVIFNETQNSFPTPNPDPNTRSPHPSPSPSPNPDSSPWRLSFISDIKGKATAPKRYTYVFGYPDLLYKTPIERFATLQKKGITFENLMTAFSVEALSDEFFDKYREQYADFIQYITGKRFVKSGSKWEEKKLGEPNDKLMQAFNHDEKKIRDYIKKMMGRITFLHFLQRKGWMCGDLNYMQNMFQNSAYKNDYLDSVLEPLFFGVLNTKPAEREALFTEYGWDKNLLHEWRDIPYLNGGLFERDDTDEPESRFLAEYFQRLFQFFSEYNFTIDENDPNDAEVGVDPEMLGKIFENLLEDNKDKGAFYTPKEIVRYMCQESLIAYLETNTTIAKDKIRQFVLTPEEGVAHIPDNKKDKLLNALKNVKICDPAIGSGAFPMGLLNELLKCREALTTSPTVNCKLSIVNSLKKDIIQNNIYGVDIEKGAVDIARLRFWLSIVVDEEKASPLPNLDYKIMQGNSLIESYKGMDLSRLTYDNKDKSHITEYSIFDDDTNQLQRRVTQLLTQYYSCSDHEQKHRLQRDISHAISQQLELQKFDPAILHELKHINLAENTHFFLWHTWFSDVFNKGGFDIVIGNPPYVSRLDDDIKKLLGHTYPEAKKKIFDLYNFFMVASIRLLSKKSGVSTLIVPPTWLNNKNSNNLRTYMANNGLYRIDYLDDKVFDAIVYSCIYFTSYSSISKIECYETKIINGNLFRERKNIIETEHIINTGDYIPLEHNEGLLSKLKGNYKYTTLGEISNIVFGIQDRKSSKDPSYVRNDKINENCKKVLNGKHINRYSIQDSGMYIEYGPWLWNPRKSEIFEVSEKILVRQVGKHPICSYDNQRYYTLNTIYNVIITDYRFSTKYVLALLNSKIMQIIWKEIYPEQKDIFPRLKKEQLVEIPIPILDKEHQQKIEEIVDSIIEIKNSDSFADTSLLDNEIDNMVYELYGLTEEEIRVVEGR